MEMVLFKNVKYDQKRYIVASKLPNHRDIFAFDTPPHRFWRLGVKRILRVFLRPVL